MKRLALAAALLPPVGFAEERLEVVVVTATRIAMPASFSTYTGNYFDSNFLEDNTRRNLPDALALVPGVLVQKTTYGHGSPYIRGQTGRANLLLLDGIRLNNSIWRGGPVQYWNTVDSFSIDRVELIKSQGSVAFGSDAIGGTLNGFTQSSQFASESAGDLFAHGAALYDNRSNGDGSYIGRLEGSVGKGAGWGLHAGMSVKEYGDIHDSSVGTMKHTGYDEDDWDVRFDAALGNATTLTLAYQDVDQNDIWRWHRTLYNPGWTHGDHVAAPGTWVANIYNQGRSLGYAKVQSENTDPDALVSSWAGTLSYQAWADSEFQDRRTNASQPLSSARYQQLQTADVETLGADFSLVSQLGPGRLVYGLDYYHDGVDSAAYRNTGAGYVFAPASRPVADDSTYELLGAYGQYIWQITTDLRVEGGLRYTHAEADLGKRWDANLRADVSSQRSWDNTVFSLRAIQQLPADWSLYGGVSQAFRAPNLSDLSGTTTARSGVESGGSVDLDPERYVTYELGTRLDGPRVSFGAALFYTDIADIITDVPVSQGSSTAVATNGRDGYLYGFETEAGWYINEQWLLSGFLAWQKGETTAPAYAGGPEIEEPYSRALPLSGSVALRWTHESTRLWVEGRVLASETADRLTASDIADNQRIPSGGTPSYVVGMLHAGWEASDHFDFTLGLENLTDEDYRIHGSGNNEPGFNVILGVKAMW